MLRPWGGVSYLPILKMSPAEMRALEELPGLTKDALLPQIPLRPWLSAHRLQSVVDRIEKSYGDRPVIVSIGEPEPPNDRPVHEELARLRNPDGGFANWCEFIAANERYVPVVQLGISAADEPRQIACLSELQQGLVVHLERPAFGALARVAALVADNVQDDETVCFVVDFGTASRDHLQVAVQALGYIQAIRAAAPNAHVCISASSFPSSFTNVVEQEIYERRLFNEVVQGGGARNLIYGDRGSARAEQLSGGSGVIPARIDYPQFDTWKFFRADEAGFQGYVEQARTLIANECWNEDLRVWGTQMIERTARGDHSAIDTPTKATAARINLHLQLQAFYGHLGDAEDTEEDWEG